MSMFRDLLSFQNGGLPKIYQQVEYISSSGTQYIDTNVSDTSGVYVEAKIRYNATGEYPCILGEQGTANSPTTGSQAPIILFYRSSTYTLYVGTNVSRSANTNFTIDTNNPQIIKSSTVDGNSFIEVDGNKTTISANDGEARGNKNLYLFALNNGGSAGFYSNARIYYLQIYDDVNGTLIRDFVPCYRKSDGVIGLYDLVNDLFYVNNGSGTFTKGNDVTS